MKEHAKTVLAIVGLISIIVAIQRVVWPFIDAEGVISEGSFREIDIGASRIEVATILTGVSPRKNSSLRMSGYVDENDNYLPLQIIECDHRQIAKSNKWYLSSPGFHKERVELVFEGDRVKSIRYTRSPFDP